MRGSGRPAIQHAAGKLGNDDVSAVDSLRRTTTWQPDVAPNLLDFPVVGVTLQRPEARDRVVDDPARPGRVGQGRGAEVSARSS